MNTTDSLTDAQIATLKAAALAATPQNIDSAQCIEHYDDGSHVACPACGGEGHVELEADFCNYDGTAIGVQFYGIGNAHGAAEAYLRAASPANVLALIERLERAEASLATTPQTDGATVALTEQQIQRIAHYCETEAHACPGTNMWQCAHMAIEETLRTLAETCLRLQIAEVCEDADGYKHIEAVIEDLDDLPKGTKLFAGAHAPAMAETQVPEGFVLVPLKPTAAIVKAGGQARIDDFNRNGTTLTVKDANRVAEAMYRAMVGAAASGGELG